MSELNEENVLAALKTIRDFAEAVGEKVAVKPTHIRLRKAEVGNLVKRLAKHRCKPSVVTRVMKLNPDGAFEGFALRGWHRKPRLWQADMIGPREFIAAHGSEAYRQVDKRWWKWYGRRKAMTKTNYLDNVWKYPFRKEN